MKTGRALLSVNAIVKSFPGTIALNGVSLELYAGEVHALVGENGAGKSTLIKIMAGLYQPDSGEIKMGTRVVQFPNPAASLGSGIRIISQEFDLVPTLSVVENIYLGHELINKFGSLSRRKMLRNASDLLTRLGVNISPLVPVSELSIADQQLVEIAKALSSNFQVLILDEPTAALNVNEVQRLFQVIRNLKERGVALLYVSHRLPEIVEVAQYVTVFRDGEKVGQGKIDTFTEHSISTLIAGEELSPISNSKVKIVKNNKSAITLKNISISQQLINVSLEMRFGEIMGLTGLSGSGRSELCQIFVGELQPQSGHIEVDGSVQVIRSVSHAIELGIAALTEDRSSVGIFPDLNVRENLFVAESRRFIHLLDFKKERLIFLKLKSQISIKAASSESSITSLSGGNQQKVLIGRALLMKGKIFVFREPTRGVDIKAKTEIHELIRSLAKQGNAVLISSADLPELVALSDCCAVMKDGVIRAKLTGKEINENLMVRWSLGVE